jgi:plasmid stability protein
MSVNLSIRNVPDDVIRGLRNRAALSQRSLQAEVLEILKQAVKHQDPVTIDALLAKAEQAKPALDDATSKVHAAQQAEHERVTRRFQDLMAQLDRADSVEKPGEER